MESGKESFMNWYFWSFISDSLSDCFFHLQNSLILQILTLFRYFQLKFQLHCSLHFVNTCFHFFKHSINNNAICLLSEHFGWFTQPFACRAEFRKGCVILTENVPKTILRLVTEQVLTFHDFFRTNFSREKLKSDNSLGFTKMVNFVSFWQIVAACHAGKKGEFLNDGPILAKYVQIFFEFRVQRSEEIHDFSP